MGGSRAGGLAAALLLLGLAGCDRSAYEGCLPDHRDPLAPVAGELTIVQLRLNGTFKHGEAALVIGPDGTTVLIDVGNSNHSEEIREALRAVNARCVTEATGYRESRAPLEVDWLVATHFHGDHVGGLEELLTFDPPIHVRRGIVHRGFTDLGGGLNGGALASACRLLRADFEALDRPLCRAEHAAPCEGWTDAHPATSCDGLLRGDLTDPGDDRGGLPSFIPLGSGARLVLLAAGGHVGDGARAIPAPRFGVDENNEENARSVVGLVEHGAFRYHFGGDLTGQGVPGVPDLETFLADTAGPHFYGDRGVDVIHAHHHVRRTSSNEAFVELTAPADGRTRHVVGGIAAHFGSPHGEVLSRWGDDDRLAGGGIWVTRSATGGDEHPLLLEADAAVVVQTRRGGAEYLIGESLLSAPGSAIVTPSVRAD